VRYGGNTSCVEVRTADNTLIVFDCGTGAWELGRTLMAESGGKPMHGHLIIGHTHWDHIQGFPFFAPLFARGWTWDVYAPGGLGPELERSLAGQMSYEYFPVTLRDLSASIRYHDLTEGEFAIGDVRIIAQYLNHTAVTLGYRVEVGGRSLVYSTDHEPHTPYPPHPGETWRPVHREDLRHMQFMSQADLVIHDCQYTEAEYPAKIGWGHTPIEHAVDYAVAAQVKELALYHHDPARRDEDLDRIVEQCRVRIAEAGSSLRVFAAAERQIVELVEGEQRGHASPRQVATPPTVAAAEPQIVELVEELENEAAQRSSRSARSRPNVTRDDVKILIVDDDPDMRRLFEASLRPEGYSLVSVGDGEKALAAVERERPALVILDYRLPGMTGVDVCRNIRTHADPHISRVPIVMVTATVREEKDIVGSFGSGVTDYLIKPITPSYLRARVRGWLLREGASS
jgi:CheY-like chemotaxis protein